MQGTWRAGGVPTVLHPGVAPTCWVGPPPDLPVPLPHGGPGAWVVYRNFFLRVAKALPAGTMGLGLPRGRVRSCWTPTFPEVSWASELDPWAWSTLLLPYVLCTSLGEWGAPCGKLGPECRNQGLLGPLTLPPSVPQFLHLWVWPIIVSWTWVYPGATGCSWGSH